MQQIINPDDILSAFYGRLNGDPVFRSMVQSIDKGPKRRNPPTGETRVENPSATIHLLTMPRDAELGDYRCTVIVNVYMDDLPTGQMDAKGLGERAARVQQLFDKAHLPTHPDGPLERDGMTFFAVYVMEPLILRSDVENEHFASVRISVIVKARS